MFQPMFALTPEQVEALNKANAAFIRQGEAANACLEQMSEAVKPIAQEIANVLRRLDQ